MSRRIPLLVTLDLEHAPDHHDGEQEEILDVLREEARALGLPLTIFCTADAADRWTRAVGALSREGHEIGCHGVDHLPHDDYQRRSRTEVRGALSGAGHRIAAASGARPRSFRGPGLATSAATQAALIDEGYRADCSVGSGRLDLLTSSRPDAGWLVAPRRPYHPSEKSAFRRGDRPLWVVPMSALGVPFVSGLLWLFGPTPMRALHRALMLEARLTGRPLVYLFHSYELTARAPGADARPRHQRAYRGGAAERRARHRAWLRELTTTGPVEPMTARDLVERLEKSP